MVYLITYDLRSSERDYTMLFSYLESNVGKESLHVMQNVWWVATNEPLDLNALCDKLREFMESTDLLSVSILRKGEYNGWLPGTSWNWLKERI